MERLKTAPKPLPPCAQSGHTSDGIPPRGGIFIKLLGDNKLKKMPKYLVLNRRKRAKYLVLKGRKKSFLMVKLLAQTLIPLYFRFLLNVYAKTGSTAHLLRQRPQLVSKNVFSAPKFAPPQSSYFWLSWVNCV